MKPLVAAWLILASVLAVEGRGNPQTPARDATRAGAAAPNPATFRLRGRILAADTSTPVRRAMVHLASGRIPEGRATLTDSDGRYEFQSLPAGSYYVSASKTGFLTALAGNELVGADSGKLVRVGDGGAAAPAADAPDILLTRACAIGGRVLDELGDPVANVGITLIRFVGGVRWDVTRIFTTNDLGQYRAPGLLPGTYYVFAESVRGDTGEIGEGIWYAPTYYPGAADPAAASPVRISAGQDMASADIVLALVRTARVSGLALDSQGQPAAGAGVRLALAQAGLSHTSIGNYARALPDGSFTVTGVPPGDYWLTASMSQGSAGSGSQGPSRRIEYGRTRVSVAGTDVTAVTVQMSGGATVSGQVVFEGARPAKAKLSISAFNEATGDPPSPVGGAATADVAPDGAFSVPGVFGDRVFRVSGLPPDWALKAVFAGGREVTDTPVPLDGRDRLSGVQIVVTDRVSHLTAHVTDERGQPAEPGAWIFIVPDDPDTNSRFGSRFVRSSVVEQNGTVKIDGLPPADYAAVACSQIPRHIDVYAPDILEQVRKTGLKFSLREAETRDIVLKLGDRVSTQ